MPVGVDGGLKGLINFFFNLFYEKMALLRNILVLLGKGKRQICSLGWGWGRGRWDCLGYSSPSWTEKPGAGAAEEKQLGPSLSRRAGDQPVQQGRLLSFYFGGFSGTTMGLARHRDRPHVSRRACNKLARQHHAETRPGRGREAASASAPCPARPLLQGALPHCGELAEGDIAILGTGKFWTLQNPRQALGRPHPLHRASVTHPDPHWTLDRSDWNH